jgi:MFS family permease
MTDAAAKSYPMRWQWICIVAVFVNATLETMLVPALPDIRTALNLTPSQMTWVFTALTLSAAVSLPLLGRLADIFGSRQVLVAVFSAITIGISLALFGGSFETLLLGQVLQGPGMALVPLSVAMLSATSADRSSLSTAPLMLAAATSTAAGLLLAGVVLNWTDYRGLFWMALIPNVVILVIAVISMQNPRRVESSQPRLSEIDWLGAVLLASALLAGLIAVTLVEKIGWTAPLVLGLLTAALVIAVLWVWRSRRARSPIIDLALLGDPAIGRAAIIQAATGFGTFSTFVLVPMLIVSAESAGGLGLDGSAAGYALAPFGIASILAPMTVAPLRKRLGAALVMIIGSIFATASPLTLAVAPNIWIVAAATAALGFGIGLILTQTFDLVGSIVPPERVASIGGLVYVLKMIGAAVGGQVTIAFVHVDGGAQGLPMGFVVAAAAMLIAALAAFSLRGQNVSGTASAVQAQ